MEFLASDALNGRGSGTRDEWIAATYIASQLRRWGLEPLGDGGDYVQDVRIERRDVTRPPVLTVSGRQFTHGKEIAVGRLSGPKLSGPLQHFRAGTPVGKGAVLLLPPSNPPAAADTVAATMVLSLESEQARTRRQAAPARPLTIQQVAGVPERATVALDKDTYAVLDALADGEVVTLDTEAKPAVVAHTWNVIGRLTGRSREAADAILLTAHLDHLGNRPTANAAAGADTINNGADDDASRSTAVLELAEALSKGKRPKRTILFAWFGSEEAGGFGAGHFIDVPPVPLENILANLEFEMIGVDAQAVKYFADLRPGVAFKAVFESGRIIPAVLDSLLVYLLCQANQLGGDVFDVFHNAPFILPGHSSTCFHPGYRRT
jgi:hypothetical protein